MSPKWYFRELPRGFKDRQATQGEFFATDAITSAAEALVRESIQNSLDARLRTDRPVQVCFYLSEAKKALSHEDTEEYFRDAWEHYEEPESGLANTPKRQESCKFLTIEDFNTTGLTGDVYQATYEKGVKNPFFYFFRTEGRSGKTGKEIGRWGIGKYVFPRSSRIHSFFAYSIRGDDPRRILMGQSILKSHRLNGKFFSPDADFGEDDQAFPLPTDDCDFISRFSSHFEIKRRDETGLSIVIPYVFDEFTHDIISQAVIENFFHPILREDLIVSVSWPGEVWKIDKTSILPLYGQCKEKDEKVSRVIQLADWADSIEDKELIKLNAPLNRRPEWTSDMLSSEIKEVVKSKFQNREKLAVHVPLTVREKEKENEQDSYFRIYLVNDEQSAFKPVFVRDGIVIKDVRGRTMSGISALVVVEDQPLAKLLGDAENPAHTQWQKDSEHFRDYTYGKFYIPFVANSVMQFIQLISAGDSEPDSVLLEDIFSIPIKDEPDNPKRTRKRKGYVDLPPANSKPPLFNIGRIHKGFTLTPGPGWMGRTSRIRVKMAYDCRSGSPWKRYEEYDFRLDQPPITIIESNVEIRSKRLNKLDADVRGDDWKITIIGFDAERDLIIQAGRVEGGNDPEN